MPLNDMLCRTAKPKSKPYKISDGEGLYLEVRPNGAKYWRIKYRIHRKEKRIALGVYPKTTLLEARQSKDTIKQQLRSGLDPAFVRLEAKQTALFDASQTFELAAREWHEKNISQWDHRYAKLVLHRLEKYTFGDLGSYPIKQLNPKIILSCLQKIEKTAPEMARRVKKLVSHVFIYGIATCRVETDLTHGLENALKKYKKGHFASIDLDELPSLLIALHNHKSRLYRQTYLAIRLLLLTFVRTVELVEASWSEINFEAAIWTIPAERMKMEKSHLVPLSKQSIAILLELKELNRNSDFIFPGITKPKKPMSKGTIWMALIRMGYHKKMTGHGFRSLALGILKEKLGYSHELADRQLAHVRKSGNDRAYDRAEFLKQRIEMMQNYADYIDAEFRKAINSQPMHLTMD